MDEIDSMVQQRLQARLSLERLAKANGLHSLEDWYSFNRVRVSEKIKVILNLGYDGDLSSALTDLYPNEVQELWRMKRVPEGFWKTRENRVCYLDWLGKKLGYQHVSDWYQVSQNDFAKNYGSSLTVEMGSITCILQDYVPDFDWLPWKFRVAPNGAWSIKANHRRFLDYLAAEEGFTETADWYRLNLTLLRKHKGISLLRHYASIVECVIANFPELDLKPWEFDRVGRGFWQGKDNQRLYLTWLGKRLGFCKPEDWYAVSESDFEFHSGISILAQYSSSPAQVVTEVFPEWNLELVKFDKKSKFQARLYGVVACALPDFEVLFNVRHPDLKFSATDARMELDIFVPELSFAIEFHGAQHTRPAWGGEAELYAIKSRDEEKRQGCRRVGIRLREIHQSDWSGEPSQILKILAEDLGDDMVSEDVFWSEVECRGLLEEFSINSDTQNGKKREKVILPDFTVDQLLEWADRWYQEKGSWPKRDDVIISEAVPISWAQVDRRLRIAKPEPSSLAKLLLEERGVIHRFAKHQISIDDVLRWSDKFHKDTGAWPTWRSGMIPESPGDSWASIRSLLVRGGRGLPAAGSLEQLLHRYRGVEGVRTGRTLTIERILSWIDDHRKIHGVWPKASDGSVNMMPHENWNNIDAALRQGLRGLAGGMSLFSLITEHRLDLGQRHTQKYSRFRHHKGDIVTVQVIPIDEILKLADAFHQRSGFWPTRNDGLIAELPNISWAKIDADLKTGRVGTHDDSLVRLLERERGRTNLSNLSTLSIEHVLEWCDSFHRSYGAYPTQTSTSIPSMGRETFRNIDAALRNGHRGLPKSGGLARLLSTHRKKRNHLALPNLTIELVLDWMRQHRRKFGVWPKYDAGQVKSAPSENWAAINAALSRGGRGLPSGLSLKKLQALA